MILRQAPTRHPGESRDLSQSDMEIPAFAGMTLTEKVSED